MIRKDYTPPSRFESKRDTLNDALSQASMPADELLGKYCTHMYHRMGSYEKAASVLELDRRTVKNHVQPSLLEMLQKN